MKASIKILSLAIGAVALSAAAADVTIGAEPKTIQVVNRGSSLTL